MGGLFLAVFRWPAAAVAGVLCVYGMEQWAQSNSVFFVTHQSLTNIATGVIMLTGITLMILRGQSVFGGYPAVGWVILALLAYSAISVVWSVYPSGTIRNWRKAWPYITSMVILCPLLIKHPRDLRDGLFATLTLGSALVTLLLFMTVLEGRHVIMTKGVGIGSLEGEAGNPLATASLAGYVVLVAVLMNFRGVARVWQLLRWAVVVIGLIVAMKSGSRGQLFAMLTALLVFLPISRQVRNLKGFAATVFALVLIAGLALWVHDSYAEANRWRWDNMVETYTGSRVNTSLQLLSHWASSNPVHLIIGLGNSASYDPYILGFYPHLVMAEVLAEEGVIGFVLLWSVVLIATRDIACSYHGVKPFPDARGVLATIGALFLFEVILSFKQGSMLGSTNAFAFAIILGRFQLGIAASQEADTAVAVTGAHPQFEDISRGTQAV